MSDSSYEEQEGTTTLEAELNILVAKDRDDEAYLQALGIILNHIHEQHHVMAMRFINTATIDKLFYTAFTFSSLILSDRSIPTVKKVDILQDTYNIITSMINDQEDTKDATIH